MKKIENFEEVEEAGEVRKLPAGIYPVKILSVEDKQEKEYLEVCFDIADGEFKGFYKDKPAKSCRSYKEKALPFFKAFITSIEKSNNGYKWNWDEKTLVGKFAIGVFGEEEYLNDDGELKVSCKLQEFRSIPAYKEGKIKVPEIKRLPEDQRPKETETQQPASMDVDTDFPW